MAQLQTQQDEGKETDNSNNNNYNTMRVNKLITALNKLTINITSFGFEDSGSSGYKGAAPIIMINGETFAKPGRGVHVIDIDTESLIKTLYSGKQITCIDEIDLKQFINYKQFDTFGKKEAGGKFLKHLNSIKNRNIVIIATEDSADTYWPKDAFAYFKYNLKVNLWNLSQIGFRETFCLIAQSGVLQPYTACVKKQKAHGPAQLNAVIKIKKNM
eukprot:136577_1